MWNFLKRYGYLYGGEECRILLPCEVLEILKGISVETKRKLAAKGYFPQDGYILQKLPVPPNWCSFSDGNINKSPNISLGKLKKVLKEAEIIKHSKSGPPNFESHVVEANKLQTAIAQYLNVKGAKKGPRAKSRFGPNKKSDDTSGTPSSAKMKTLFTSKSSNLCSRNVITGDSYQRVDEIGLPSDVAQKITFEEKVTVRNLHHLQELVDKKLCLTYTDGGSTYSLREGSKGHTSLKVGQLVRRQIMDGDIVFINRQPSTQKHSLQALSVYVHDELAVKINPLICIHVFYPQSFMAKAEVLELFSVEHQQLSSHSGKLNLQLANDALLSLKIMFKICFLQKKIAQQLAMHVSSDFQVPALLKASGHVPQWTALQILQNALPANFDCSGERYAISQSEIVKFDYNRNLVQSTFNDIIKSVFLKKGSQDALQVFNSLQPLLMENIFLEGYSVSLEDFCIPKSIKLDLYKNVQGISPLLYLWRSAYSEGVELQVENHLRSFKVPVVNFILKTSSLGNLIDSKNDSSVNKVVQQLGILGIQLFDKEMIYSKSLVEDITAFFQKKIAVNGNDCPSEAYGLINSCFFHGLNPCEQLVNSISSREVLVRQTREIKEAGTLFKHLVAILRDVVICYEGTVRNVCSNSVIQFEYLMEAGTDENSFSPAGEPVGALAATAIANPAYKTVLDSSANSNSSWKLMKEILECRVNLKKGDDHNDFRAILYLNDCSCGRNYCREKAAYSVQNHLIRRNLKSIANTFLIEFGCLAGHVLTEMKCVNRSLYQVLQRCQQKIGSIKKKKDRLSHILSTLSLSVSECCSFSPCDAERSKTSCLQFSWKDSSAFTLEQASQFSNTICSILFETAVTGDPRVYMANIIWVSPDTTTWVRKNDTIQKGEVAVEVILEKEVVKSHDATLRISLDSCLPVIHLIDTRRSIPYGIKQLQEVIGISCAFDQTVERLTTSVRMVAKDVMKEHLILVANSISVAKCANTICRSYKTPRKCFEKAAEKCQLDSLSSTVASCAFGKHVAAGTGAPFEILWNKKEMGFDGPVDTFDFLQIVNTGTNERGVISGCLGEEVDDIERENGGVDLALSPKHPDGSKLIFDDSPQFGSNLLHNQISEGNWWNNFSQTGESCGRKEWKVGKKLISGNPTMASNSDARPGWGLGDQEEKKILNPVKSADTWGTSVVGEKLNQPVESQAWGSSVGVDQTENDIQWSQRKESPAKPFPWRARDNSRVHGSSSAGDLKSNFHLNNTQGTSGGHNLLNASRNCTATGQRLDLFTSEEQIVLSEVEPVVQEKHDEPLSSEDQSYVLENVFKYHPNKDVKMGSGIDHLTVNLSLYEGSRCFYIVSTDGRREDFSYIKCIKKFVKEKYAAVAESFNGKYFKTPHDRGVTNRKRRDVGVPSVTHQPR
ncbi:hypothetical protein MKX03_035397 [Papaver bracteatum]|nr:hypothetical protein MKX03_035397 [Papaver bracteatum]